MRWSKILVYLFLFQIISLPLHQSRNSTLRDTAKQCRNQVEQQREITFAAIFFCQKSALLEQNEAVQCVIRVHFFGSLKNVHELRHISLFFNILQPFQLSNIRHFCRVFLSIRVRINNMSIKCTRFFLFPITSIHQSALF